MNKKGFTLIELLVVIAIIGMLSSLAVVSLNSARNKAKDAQIQSDLSQFRTYATVEYSDGIFDGTGDNSTALSIVNVPNIEAPTGTAYEENIGTSAWVVWSTLIADSANMFCVDSSGAAKVVADADLSAATVCP